MKKLIFGLIATVVFGFDGKAQTIDELGKSNNIYNSKGEAFYNYLNETYLLAKEGKKSLDEISTETKNENFEFNIKLNDSEIEFYENFFKDKNINLKNLILFENHILKNDPYNKQSALLESIAIIKYGSLFCEQFGLRSVAGFEICLDRCLAKKAKALFQDSNWVEQAGFILFAGESFAWWVGSCSWDCRNK